MIHLICTSYHTYDSLIPKLYIYVYIYDRHENIIPMVSHVFIYFVACFSSFSNDNLSDASYMQCILLATILHNQVYATLSVVAAQFICMQLTVATFQRLRYEKWMSLSIYSAIQYISLEGCTIDLDWAQLFNFFSV